MECTNYESFAKPDKSRERDDDDDDDDGGEGVLFSVKVLLFHSLCVCVECDLTANADDVGRWTKKRDERERRRRRRRQVPEFLH